MATQRGGDVQEAIGSRRTYRYLLHHKPVERETATPEVLESLMAPVAGFQIEQAPVVIVWYLDFSALDVQGDRLRELMEARAMGVDLQKGLERPDF